MHVSTQIGVVFLATAAMCENTTLASLVFRNDTRAIDSFVERTMPLAGNTSEITKESWNATLQHALAVSWDRNASRCQPLQVPKGCRGTRDEARELEQTVAMQRAVCASGVSGASNYSVESGFQACVSQKSTNQTCASHALQCVTTTHDPTPGLVDKWVGDQARSRAIRASAIALVCTAVATALVVGVLAAPIGGLAADEVAGSGLSRELPWIFGRFSRSRGAPRVLEIQFLGLNER
jgi:hypothetical protein